MIHHQMMAHQQNASQQNTSVVSTPTGEYMPQPFQNIEQGKSSEHFSSKNIYEKHGNKK